MVERKKTTACIQIHKLIRLMSKPYIVQTARCTSSQWQTNVD